MSDEPWEKRDWVKLAVWLCVSGFLAGNFSCATFVANATTRASDVCRILAKEKDNTDIIWRDDRCLRNQPPMPLDIEVKP